MGDGIVGSPGRVFPDLAASHHGALQDIGDRFADYLKFVVWNHGYAGCGYVLDTTRLYPSYIICMREKTDKSQACFDTPTSYSNSKVAISTPTTMTAIRATR